VCSNSRLFSKIEKTHPDVVVMDFDLYAKIDGIETSRKIKSQFYAPAMYVSIMIMKIDIITFETS
jgi:chemotaxis response regulator CheB